MKKKIEGVSEAYLRSVVRSCAELMAKAEKLNSAANASWEAATSMVLSEHEATDSEVKSFPGENGLEFFLVSKSEESADLVE